MILALFSIGNIFSKAKDAITNKVVNTFIKSYLGGLLKRFDGYKMTIGAIVLLLSAGLPLIPANIQPFIQTVLELLLPYAPQDLPQVNTGELIGAVLMIYGAIHKLFKYFRQTPTVPNEVVPKNQVIKVDTDSFDNLQKALEDALVADQNQDIDLAKLIEEQNAVDRYYSKTKIG